MRSSFTKTDMLAACMRAVRQAIRIGVPQAVDKQALTNRRVDMRVIPREAGSSQHFKSLEGGEAHREVILAEDGLDA